MAEQLLSAHIGPPEFEPAVGKPGAAIMSWLLSSQGDGTHWQNCVPQYCIAPACRYLQMSPHAAAVGTPRSWLPPPVTARGKRATKSASKILVCMAGLLRNHASGLSASCWGLGHTLPSAVQTCKWSVGWTDGGDVVGDVVGLKVVVLSE